MRTSTIRICSGGAAAALILVRATNCTPDPEARLPIPAQALALFANSGTAFDTGMPRSGIRARPISLIDRCFTADLDANIRPPQGQLALVLAAFKQDWQLVRRLMDAGAPVDSADSAGVTPLMIAAMHGNVEMLRTLLERRAKSDPIDLSGRTAIHYAIAAGNLEAVQLLLPLISNIKAVTIPGCDLLGVAFDTGDMRIFQAVLECFPATLQWTANTRRALDAALRAGMKEQVRLLLSKHPTPPTPEGSNVPLIAYAIIKDDPALFSTLLACGTDPNTALPQACDKNFISLLKSKYLRLYVEEETDVNLLMLAAGLGKADYVRALLDAGADRNRMTPREKMLPLYFAARSKNWRCVQMLLGGGPLPDQLHIEISLASQHVTVIKDGVTIFTTECSTGRDGFPTPAGQYVITDKDRDHRSTIYKVAMPYFMRLNCRDFGMHGGVVPNRPASHGCIRLPSAAARRLFAEIPVGTVVMIN